MLKQLMDAFSPVDDPRCEYKVEYDLVEILVMAICAVIACAPELGRHCTVCPKEGKLAEKVSDLEAWHSLP